ncbi:MBOAT family protein [Gluconacetobacter entanii]|uniref:MBOAT family O-acyltransferase n=1 Tax=Gluconacetobacter entanii TaxID=108528 RepID=UPI001C933C74|nr:MBOAT family protein [Gluconacetobacter entanii]MBY4638709.1 MBOAT family protein [Gluconacetobacter entanii]MCW4581323.1 MBOAT family protein [Gluconacetobacter entanii]MCW4584538.1 MBOAT family protein [Gluconacetobacter entanii]MCW4587952.1 MBOAT family protein [Gluconacetobacter entanii]
MLFSTQGFLLGFLPVVLVLYYLCAPVRRARQGLMIAASLVFYGLWDWRFVPFLVGMTLLNWALACLWGRTRRRAWLLGGIAFNICVLVFFKDANWLAGVIAALRGQAFHPWDIVLPLGLSFFVFQKISYLVDLMRGQAPVYGLVDFLEFVTFFPQLIAGPIVRHNEIVPQFAQSPRNGAMWENLSRGAMLLLVGLAKKAGLADTLASLCDPVFALLAQGHVPGMGQAWLAALAYTLQIYFDFSGYSDMAIGMALMFGLRLPFNFEAPYRSVSIRDFWRRWHMTLSRFLRDYLYIPMGGNRCGAARQACNLGATMLLAGAWHGAGWTYLVWGGLHGGVLAVAHWWGRRGGTMPALAGWVVTMLFVMLSWVVFRAPDLGAARTMLLAMAGMGGHDHAATGHHGVVLAIAMAVAVVGPSSQRAILRDMPPAPWVAVAGGIAFVLLILLIGGRIPDPFIYFQF